MISYKLVEFSYPSSTNASRLGFSKTGCYTLHTASTEGHKTLSGHATLKEAKAAGELLPHPWHPAMREGWRSN